VDGSNPAGCELPLRGPEFAQELELFEERLLLRCVHQDRGAAAVLRREDRPSPTLNASNRRVNVSSARPFYGRF